jgi:hypothetical protein
MFPVRRSISAPAIDRTLSFRAVTVGLHVFAATPGCFDYGTNDSAKEADRTFAKVLMQLNNMRLSRIRVFIRKYEFSDETFPYIYFVAAIAPLNVSKTVTHRTGSRNRPQPSIGSISCPR